MSISKDEMRSMLEKMLKIRHFENRVKDLFAAGELPGFVHLYLGQEAIAAGVCSALRSDDYITSTHRGHGHIIAKGGEMKYMMAELYGKKTGYNKGKGGSMHIAWPELGILGANGIVGAGIPIATGAALSAKVQGRDKVTACFFGDGASNEGSFHESLNMAGAFKLPIVYVCENNLFGVSTRQTDVRGVQDVAVRAESYGFPGIVVDGNDVIAVNETACEAVKRARAGEGPTLIECKTYRWRTHFEGEPDTYRPPEEVQAWMQKEPIGRYKDHMINNGYFTRDEIDQLESSIVHELDEAVEFSRQSPLPEPEEALEGLWA